MAPPVARFLSHDQPAASPQRKAVDPVMDLCFLGGSHNTLFSVDEVLDVLQSHFKSQGNEALRCRELLCCKQAVGESFSDIYVRLKNLAEEVDLCSCDPVSCAETQVKMVLIMIIREELIQRLISMDAGAPLLDLVTCCCSFKAARNTASTIQSLPSQLFSVSAYRRGKRRDKAASSIQHPPSGQ